MTTSLKQLCPATPLTVANQILYTCPNGSVCQVQKMSLVNPSLTDNVWATVWLMPSGQLESDADVILPQTVILAGASLDVTAIMGQIMKQGDQIAAACEVDQGVNAFASGMEVTT